ncbi:unnamed protein product [Brachionus calyciflorus]|uniref:Nose resistant-to-fluoxetine protein N-terminal domain-containing protein n=1 Tax=Brachionus calyciflorus TaxID=104777 RepID=A0A814I381_9BILA|nr:unnamed protein product [Brachionus calyciflorus]
MKIRISFSWLFILILFLEANESLQDDDPKPALSLNVQLPQEAYQNLSSAVYIGQFANFILTGSYTGETEPDKSYDDVDLDKMFDAGLLILLSIFDKHPPQNINEILNDLRSIKDDLREKGTTGVKYGRISKYLTGNTLKNGALVYFAMNKDKFAARYKKYLLEEFLGGLTGACKTHTALWFDEITKGRLWALQMFDSLAKFPSGVLDANINWVGSFKLCTTVYNDTIEPPLRGKYCRASIGFPVEQLAGDLPIDKKTGLTYGLCIPETCDNKQTSLIVSNTLKLMSVFKYAWVQDVECVEKKPISTPSMVYIVLLSILILWIFIATVIDVSKRILGFINSKNNLNECSTEVTTNTALMPRNTNGEQNEKLNKRKKISKLDQFIIDCSFYSNSEKFFRTDNGGEITCLDGIRLFSMLWIIWSHTYNYIIERIDFFLVDNIKNIHSLNQEPKSQLIINGMFGVDSFFLMGAFLLTFKFLSKLKKSNRLTPFEWVYYYVQRYWRLAPPMLITLVIFNWIIPYMGYGPLWNQNNFPRNNEDCHRYWWTYVLFINNFVPNGKGTQCMGYFWYIPNDYQFYAVSPFFLIILFKFPKIGKAVLLACLVATLSVLGYLSAQVYESRNKVIEIVLVDMWEDVYIKPYCRASPWIIGMFLGYLFYKLKNKPVKLNYVSFE